MLYNPEWKKSDDVHSLDNLIAWLERQPADGTYNYCSNTECLLAQYFNASGIKIAGVSGNTYRTMERPFEHIAFPAAFGRVALGTDMEVTGERTFSGALNRAKALKEKNNG